MKLRYSLFVLIGAISYGLLSTIVKLAYEQGFATNEVVAGQFISGWMILLILVLLFSRKRVPIKSWLLLAVVGTTTALTGIFYYISLQTVPASIAIVLLFQFVWIGVIIEAIAERTFPDRLKCLSVGILLIGTVLAGGIFQAELEWAWLGTVTGLLAALFFALFIFVSGKAATDVHPLNRSFAMITGSLILVMVVYPPGFLLEGETVAAIWKYAVPLGVLGMVIPPILFAIGVPKVGAGLGTIISSVELPTVIIMSSIVLKESVSIMQWFGGVLILLGVAVPQWGAIRKQVEARRLNHPKPELD